MQWTFSPLFIGEGTSTLGRLAALLRHVELSVPSSSGKVLQLRIGSRGWSRVRFFQSPLHRGRYFNPFRLYSFDLATRSFSPLFIGEGTSTHGSMRCQHSGRSFSPLFIGEGTST